MILITEDGKEVKLYKVGNEWMINAGGWIENLIDWLEERLEEQG